MYMLTGNKNHFNPELFSCDLGCDLVRAECGSSLVGGGVYQQAEEVRQEARPDAIKCHVTEVNS